MKKDIIHLHINIDVKWNNERHLENVVLSFTSF
jgi:hypothetical protein